MSITDLVNRRSTAFKALKISESSLTDETAAALITENPRIMTRPLLTDGKSLVMGFDQARMQELLGKE